MLKPLVKKALPAGRKLRRLRGGIASRLLMQIDLQSQLQRFVGLDECEICNIVRSRSAGANTMVDVGANDGYYTLAFLNSTARYVVSCEPSAVSEELLANAAANGHPISERFRLERRLVGNGPGNVTIAELLIDLPAPVFIKVDVDGGEVGVLQSAELSPALAETTWVVETHSAALERECIDWFCRHGYATSIVRPAWWRRWLPERRPIEHNQWLIAEPRS